MPYEVMELSQHWFRWWLGAWWHQAITWTNVDLSLVGFCAWKYCLLYIGMPLSANIPLDLVSFLLTPYNPYNSPMKASYGDTDQELTFTTSMLYAVCVIWNSVLWGPNESTMYIFHMTEILGVHGYVCPFILVLLWFWCNFVAHEARYFIQCVARSLMSTE